MQASITLPDDLQIQLDAAARAEGKTVDQLTAEVLERHFAHRSLERFKRDGEMRRRGMSDEQVERIVDQAITEVRGR
jgi:predicted DNA-binding protein